MSVVLSEHLPLLASAPDGIQKLRGLILELAVRGKLISSDWNIDLAPLSMLCSTRSGNSKLIKGKLLGHPVENSFPCFSASGQDVWHSQHEHEGDAVILSAVGARCGKAFIAKGKWSAIANTHVLFPNNEYCSVEYLHLICNNEKFWIRGGSAQPFVKVAATLKERRVYCPPIDEQHRIVAKVDELMALCDRLEAEQTDADAAHAKLVETLLGTLTQSTDAVELAANWQRLAEHFHTLFTTESSLDALKQTILQLAVMGKLVPQDPNDEPASELLKRIAKERARLEAEGVCKKMKAMPLVGEDEQPFSLPQRWSVVRLSQLVSILGDGLHGTPEYESGTPYFFINGNNLIDRKIVIKPTTKSVSKSQYEKHKKPLGDSTVLVSINGTLGRIAYYDDEKIILGKSACFFNLLPLIYKDFIRLVLESQYFLSYAFSSATGSTIKNLGLKAMNDFPLGLPPLVEQHRIVAKVDELMALCDRLKAAFVESRARQARLSATLIESALQAA